MMNLTSHSNAEFVAESHRNAINSLSVTFRSREITMKIGPLVPIKRPSKKCILNDWSILSPEELNAAVVKNNGGNIGLRLDHYASLDPDSMAARNLCEQWEKEGKLPPTVAWRTASGAIRRLYLAPAGLERMQIPDLKFDLRHGSGVQDVIPPSYVVDPEKGIKGAYEWLPDQDPGSIEVAPLPEFVLEFFKTNSLSLSFKNSSTYVCKEGAKTISLDQGGRDEELFHIALTLFKGGMQYPDVEYIIENLAHQCTPPFSENDARKKVESAHKRYEKQERKPIANQVREWVSVTPGDFSVKDCYLDLGSVTIEDKASTRKAIERMVAEGLVMRIAGKKGMYRPVVSDMAAIKLKDANKQGSEIELKYPFGLEEWYKTFSKTVVIVAGCPDAGKTAFLLDFVYKNLGRPDIPPLHYFTSEMGVDEFLDRASNIPGFNVDYWDKHLSIWERSEIFEDVIMPDAINIIDYLDIQAAGGEFYDVGKFIHRIWNKLKKGVAIIALQKDSAKDWGKGGVGSAERARLYLSLEPGNPTKGEPNIMKVLKIKNWRNRLTNIKGKEFPFRLVNGCTFKMVEEY